MGKLCLITDDLTRGQRLARELGRSWTCEVFDLYAADAPETQFEFVVSDVCHRTPENIVRLQGALTRTRRGDVPYLFLVHGNANQAESHARELGADRTLGASVRTQALTAALEALRRVAPPVSATAVRYAGGARQFLADVFVTGRPMTPTVVDAGTELIARAVREAGVRDWIGAVQRFDDATHQHCLLVAGLATALAQHLGFAARDRHLLTKAALLHDVGKIDVPKAILNKHGPLTPAERAEMEKHPSYGYAMLTGRGFEAITLTVVRSHHEMLDGSGYPDRLAGTEIHDLVRLVTVCDIFGALIERRAYKAPMAGQAAMDVLERMGNRLDADFVEAFRPIAAAYAVPAS